MNYKRIGRTIMCLLLVCVLLVNVSPIRAEASTIAVGTILAQAWPVIKAAAVGLGLVGTTDSMVDSLVDNLSSDGFIDEDGNMEVYHFGDGLFGVGKILLERIHDLFFDLEFAETNPAYATLFYLNDSPYGACSIGGSEPFNIASFTHGGNTFLILYSEVQASLEGRRADGSRIYPNLEFLSDNGFYFTAISSNYGAETDNWNVPYLGDVSECSWPSSYTGYYLGNYALKKFAGSLPSETTSPLVESGYIAPAGSSFSEGYQEWSFSSIDVGNETYYAPIGTTAIAGSTAPSYSQEDVWTGTTPIIIIDEKVIEGGGTTEPTQPDDGTGKFYPMDPNYTSLIERLFGNVSDKIEYVAYSIEEIPEILREFMKEVKEGLERLPGQFKEWFDDIRTKLQQLVTGQITLADLLAGLFQPIRDAVVDALTYLFAPSETFIQSKVETLIAKYPTADTFFNLGNSLGAFFGGLGATPPIIYIDLGAAEGSYFLGGREVFLDLTWYSRYKPTVDAIIGAFIWLWLAWRVFLSIPSIIHGEAGTWGDRKTDIGAANTSGATIVHQRELPSGKK